MIGHVSSNRWWVFDRPLLHDPLVVVALVIGVASVIGVVASRDSYGSGAFVFALVTSIPSGVLTVGIVAGTVREFVRGRRESV